MKKGFTLAEVLITLGIIGVVAAMTLPVLIDKHHKKVFVTQLKKGVNVIENSVRRFMLDESLETLSDNEWELYASQIPKYLTVTKAPESNLLYKEYNDGTTKFYVLNDGITFMPASNKILIDVNGDKKPNLPGRDRFVFEFKNTGFVNYSSAVSAFSLEEMNKFLGVMGVTWNKMPACNKLGDEVINSMIDSFCGENKDCIESLRSNTELVKPMMNLMGMMACFGQVVNDNWEMKY